MALFLVTLSDP